jgi:hypothetical protein
MALNSQGKMLKYYWTMGVNLNTTVTMVIYHCILAVENVGSQVIYCSIFIRLTLGSIADIFTAVI